MIGGLIALRSGSQYNVLVIGDMNDRVGSVVLLKVVGRNGVPGRSDLQ